MIKKIGFVTFTDILTKLFSYLLLPIYLGIMPKNEFGEFTFLFSFLSPVSMVFSFSLFVPFIRNFSFSKKIKEQSLLVSTIFNSVIIWIIFLAILFIIASPILINEFVRIFGSSQFINIKFFLMVGLIVNAVFALFIYSLLIARSKTFEICSYIFIKFILTATFSLLFLYTDWILVDTVVDRLLGFFITELILNIFFSYYILRSYLSFKLNKIILYQNLKVALPLVPISLISLSMILIDRKLILSYHGLSDLADYNLTFQILLPIQTLMSAIQIVWAPYLFSIEEKNKAFNLTIDFSFKVFILLIIACVGLWVLIQIFLYLNVINESYKGVPKLILYGSLGMIFMTLNHLVNNMFVHLNETKLQLILSIFILILFYFTSLYFIPTFSSVGASISMGITQGIKLVLGFIILFILCKNTNKI